MSGKTAELYEAVFDFIEKKLIHLHPVQFMADFEAGLRNAINNYYHDAILYGCWYHFCAAVRRKFLSLKMYQLLKDVPKARKIYRMILSLPLLPSPSILNGFNIIKQEANAEGLAESFKSIFQYFEQYWLLIVSCLFNCKIVIRISDCVSNAFRIFSSERVFHQKIIDVLVSFLETTN